MPDYSGYRFRDDPAIPSGGPSAGGWGDQYRFRPLTRDEKGRIDTDPQWRPWEEDRGAEEPPDLFDSMSRGDAGVGPGYYDRPLR